VTSIFSSGAQEFGRGTDFFLLLSPLFLAASIRFTGRAGLFG